MFSSSTTVFIKFKSPAIRESKVVRQLPAEDHVDRMKALAGQDRMEPLSVTGAALEETLALLRKEGFTLIDAFQQMRLRELQPINLVTFKFAKVHAHGTPAARQKELASAGMELLTTLCAAHYSLVSIYDRPESVHIVCAGGGTRAKHFKVAENPEASAYGLVVTKKTASPEKTAANAARVKAKYGEGPGHSQ